MTAKLFSFLIIVISVMIRCAPAETMTPEQTTVEHAHIYQELLGMEYALYTADFSKVVTHSDQLDQLLKRSYNLFCPEESVKIDAARTNNHLLKDNIQHNRNRDYFDDLRALKATIIRLETDEDYDPYFAFLWRFEEEMYLATGVAMDPMLDLYEYNEFEDMVACMITAWEPVQLHSPDPAFLDENAEKYKEQTVYKIYLEGAVNHFNTAVQRAGHKDFPLCEAAESLRGAYKAYINTFIQFSSGPDLLLARI